jgi:hypothetical protein
MNSSNKRLILLSIVVSLLYIKLNVNNFVKLNEVEVIECTPDEIELERFLNDIALKESGNDYTIVNKYGYMGKYQFSMKTLRGLGYKISKTDFLNNPFTQDEAMINLLKYNKSALQKYINKWDGQIYKGHQITESGILAAAHLAGENSVKNYFKEGVNKSDSFGTSIDDYIIKFSGYKIKI